jgi:cytochrome c oxidase assembly protein subunit 15
MNPEPTVSRRNTAQVLALLTAGLIFPLIYVGAGVTTKDAGMIFSDWPTSDGAYLNPAGWLDDAKKLWEHGHRLIGWAVGMLAIGSAVASWRGGSAARTLTLITLAAIILQGLMGGFRVREISRNWALVHAIWGQLTFCIAAITALMTSRSAHTGSRIEVAGAKFYQMGGVVSFCAVLIQLCLGAWYRHFDSNTALIAHVLWALVVFMVLSWLTMWTLEQYPRLQPLAFLGKSMAVMIALQMVLGGAAFLIRVMGGNWPGWIATLAPSAHVAVGALMLACTALLTISGFLRLVPEAPTTERQPTTAVMI